MKVGFSPGRSRAAIWARRLGSLAVPVLAVNALGTRAGLIPPEAVIPIVALACALALLALALAVYGLVEIWRTGAEGAGAAVVGLVYALPVLALLALVGAAAMIYPPLTDVTTDPQNPPALAGVAPPEPPAEPGGTRYPDLAPRVFTVPIGDVYGAARVLVEERGWTVTREVPPLAAPAEGEVAAGADEAEQDGTPGDAAEAAQADGEPAAPSDGEAGAPVSDGTPEAEPDSAVLEAVARTFLLRFEDDVTVRIQQAADGVRVDMRSASRIGAHDLGQNARRIRAFLNDLQAALEPEPDGAGPRVPEPAQVPAADSPASAPSGETPSAAAGQ